jgi:malonyl-CoA O-methyltransferase
LRIISVNADFSTVAASYDAHAAPQRRAAAELLAFTGTVAPRTIMEPGCGSGLYTRLLLAAFPQATLLGVDIAGAMVAAARRRITDPRVSFHQADAEDFARGSFDLITSNATLQWFTDLRASLARLMGLLNAGGLLSFSFFGPETYRELDQALQDVFGAEHRVTCRRFADAQALAACLQAVSPRWEMDTRMYTQTFPSIQDLLASIKHTGTRGRTGGPPLTWTPRSLARLEEAYLARCGAVCASYQVLLCKAWSPLGSQASRLSPAES